MGIEKIGMSRLEQLIGKASFAAVGDKFTAQEMARDLVLENERLKRLVAELDQPQANGRVRSWPLESWRAPEPGGK